MNRSSDATEVGAAAGAERMMFSFLDAARAIEGKLETELGAVGLSMSKLGVLTQLVEAGTPLPLSALAARLACVRSNMTQLVDRLEAEGLVRRMDDPNDRRSVLAMVTPHGTERQAAGAKVLAAVQGAFAEALSGADQSALARALAALE